MRAQSCPLLATACLVLAVALLAEGASAASMLTAFGGLFTSGEAKKPAGATALEMKEKGPPLGEPLKAPLGEEDYLVSSEEESKSTSEDGDECEWPTDEEDEPPAKEEVPPAPSQDTPDLSSEEHGDELPKSAEGAERGQGGHADSDASASIIEGEHGANVQEDTISRRLESRQPDCGAGSILRASIEGEEQRHTVGEGLEDQQPGGSAGDDDPNASVEVKPVARTQRITGGRGFGSRRGRHAGRSFRLPKDQSEGPLVSSNKTNAKDPAVVTEQPGEAALPFDNEGRRAHIWQSERAPLLHTRDGKSLEEKEPPPPVPSFEDLFACMHMLPPPCYRPSKSPPKPRRRHIAPGRMGMTLACICPCLSFGWEQSSEEAAPEAKGQPSSDDKSD